MRPKRDSWTLTQWEAEDGLYLVRTRDRAPTDNERAAFPVVIRAIWEFDASGDDDVPDEVTFKAMTAFENALYRAMDHGRWAVGVAVITGGGQKEWLCYAADADEFAQELHNALEDHPEYPLTLDTGPDADWAAFGELLPKPTLH